MKRALARIASAIATVWAVVSLTFLLQHALADDPARAVAGAQARPADVARIRAQLALDRPLVVQYARFLGRLAHAAGAGEDHASCAAIGPVHVDLGTSYQRRRAVLTLLAERVPRSIALAFAAVLAQVAIGTLAGALAATRRGRATDSAIVGVTLVLVSAPTFVVGAALQWLLAVRLGWLPLDGYGRTMLDHAVALVLPALTLGLVGAGAYARLVRDELGVLLASDFARTARAKGASESRVVIVHALRAAALPLVTLIGLDVGQLVGGAIVTEKLFRYPGMGQLAVEAVFDRDAPVVLGTVIVASAAVALANLAVDASAELLDPRARRAGDGVKAS